MNGEEKLIAMREGGRILTETMAATIDQIRPGRPLAGIDAFFEREMEKRGGQPSFKKVANYFWATCININDGVVHGIPNAKKVKDGDLISLDGGCWWKGFHTDMAYTFSVGGNRGKEIDPFLAAGKKALKKAIVAARSGNRVGDISFAIQKTIEEDSHYYCVDSLTGHGIGRSLHEEPFIPCKLFGRQEQTEPIGEGKALAIEVIYTLDRTELITDEDNWTIRTRDGKIAALFEKTVFVGTDRTETLTPFSWEKNAR